MAGGGGILGIGTSGLLAHQRALTTVSHNISNVNTDGYSRQQVDFNANQPEQTGVGFLGTGVKIQDISRVYDEFLNLQVQSSTSGYNQLEIYSRLAGQVDNLLADPQAGLMPSLQGFFDAVQNVADDPASLPARQVLLSAAQGLTDRFDYLDQRLKDLGRGVNADIESTVNEINSLTSAIGDLNKSISNASSVSSGAPNDLLDQRDLLITRLSEKITVSTVAQDNGSINVFIGNGQPVVADFESRPLGIVANAFDAERVEVGYITSAGIVNITNQLSGGSLGGAIDFRNQILDSSQNTLGQLAVGVTSFFNSQHRLGMDLNGALGGDFFTPLETSTPLVFNNNANTGIPAAQIGVIISDASQITNSDYRLERNGTNYLLTRLTDNTTFSLATFPGGPETIDGITISLASGAIADGDSFRIQPVRNGSRNMSVAITDTNMIAAASPVRTNASLANTGVATIDQGVVVDAALYDGDSYTAYMAAATPATGALVFADDTAGPAVNNALQYTLTINGTTVYTANEAGPFAGTLDALAVEINNDTATTGVRARVDNTNNTLYLVNEPQTALPITVVETMSDSGATPLDPGDSVTGYFGSALTGGTPSNTLNYSGVADSYIVVDSAGNTETSGAYTAGAPISFNGITTSVTGQANTGDSFSIVPNINGVSDNRNALMLAGLQTRLSLNGNSASFEGVYSQLVVDVGAKTFQADFSLEAQSGLLDQAIAARESKSGVNLDEEAANLLRFQQAYQASAQVIAAANSLFQTLIQTIGR